jgi:hypothetical protein
MNYLAKIRERMLTDRTRGWQTSDFDDLMDSQYPKDAAGQYLSRLCRYGDIQRVGPGIYAVDDNRSQEELIKIVLQRMGEPRFLPAQATALRFFELPAPDGDALVTTNPVVKRFNRSLPSWKFLKRDVSRRELSVKANAVLEVLRFRSFWVPGSEEGVEEALVRVLRTGVGSFGSTLEHERNQRLIDELRQRARSLKA